MLWRWPSSECTKRAWPPAWPTLRGLQTQIRGLRLGFCRDLYPGWDMQFGPPDELRDTLTFLADVLPSMNEGSIWKSLRGNVVAGDASALGFGARPLVLDGVIPSDLQSLTYPSDELLQQQGLAPFRTSFTAQQCMVAESNHFSSTAREVLAISSYFESTVFLNPGSLSNKGLMYITDSKDAYYNINRIRGGPRVFPFVRQTWQLAMRLKIGLEAFWLPRTALVMQGADMDSKVIDRSDLALSDFHYEFLCHRFGRPTLDTFADNANTKCQSFYSQFICPGTRGIDSFVLPWAELDGSRTFRMVNGPFGRMHDIIRKIREEEADCILLVPDWPCSWQASLLDLPIRDKVALPIVSSAGQKQHIYRYGACYPRPAGSGYTPKFRVTACLVKWVVTPTP